MAGRPGGSAELPKEQDPAVHDMRRISGRGSEAPTRRCVAQRARRGAPRKRGPHGRLPERGRERLECASRATGGFRNIFHHLEKSGYGYHSRIASFMMPSIGIIMMLCPMLKCFTFCRFLQMLSIPVIAEALKTFFLCVELHFRSPEAESRDTLPETGPS